MRGERLELVGRGDEGQAWLGLGLGFGLGFGFGIGLGLGLGLGLGVGVGLGLGLGLGEGQACLRGDHLGDVGVVPHGGVQARADGGAAEGQLTHARQGRLDARDAVLHLGWGWG